MFGWSENETEDFLNRIDVLLLYGKNIFGQRTIEFSHKYIGEWLNNNESYVYHSYRSDAISCQTLYIKSLFNNPTPLLTEYEARYTLPLLFDADYMDYNKRYSLFIKSKRDIAQFFSTSLPAEFIELKELGVWNIDDSIEAILFSHELFDSLMKNWRTARCYSDSIYPTCIDDAIAFL